MKINEKKLIKLNACDKGVEMFRRYPGLANERAELGALCRWTASKGEAGYVHWLLPRLMEPELAVRWAILTAKRQCADADWNKWADGWLSGEDRTEKSAEAAECTGRLAAVWAAAWAAWAAARMEQAAMWTVEAVSGAYVSAEDKTVEIELQISDAMEILSVDGKSGKRKG